MQIKYMIRAIDNATIRGTGAAGAGFRHFEPLCPCAARALSKVRRHDMLNARDINTLNSLITTTIDSALGFERSADDARSARFVQMFREFGMERREVVSRLQEQVRVLGGTPADDGSLLADLHRRVVDLHSAISGGDEAVISEVERGEDHLKSKYEEALADNELASETLAAIREAFASVRAGHDRVSAIKNSLQANEA